jgi:two-component system chemotaxis response regulator CheY
VLKILIADDTQFIRNRINKLLTKHGYEVIEAEDGNEAVDKYHLNRPDAVFMDITMPCKDGLTALTEIRKFDPAAKVIMLSALGQQNVILQAIQAGAKDFLVKPCFPDRIIKTLQRNLV